MACGGDDGDSGTCEDDGGASCFEPPAAAMIAHDPDGGSGPANYACAAFAPVTSTQAVTINGTVKHYTNSTPLAGITLEAHATLAFASPIVTATTASDGSFSVSMPSGTQSVFHIKATGSSILPAFAAYQKFDTTMTTIDMVDFRGPTADVLDTLTGLVRVDQQPGKGSIALSVSDCDGNSVEHAIVTISTASKAPTHAPGINVFYTAPGDFPLPLIRSEQVATNDNGAAAVLNVTPSSGTLFAQAWGFLTEADVAQGRDGLTLVAEWEVPIEADAVSAAALRPSEGP